MTDDRLRSAKRHWDLGGGSEEEVSYLREQLRAGLLSRRGLELAARLGHAASVQVLGVQPLAANGESLDLRRWGARACLHGILSAMPLSEASQSFHAARARWSINSWTLTHGIEGQGGWGIMTCCQDSCRAAMEEARSFASASSRAAATTGFGGITWRMKSLLSDTGCPAVLMAVDLISAPSEWDRVTAGRHSHWRRVDRSALTEHVSLALIDWALGRCCEATPALDGDGEAAAALPGT
jgi:hypothetical protein